MVDDRDRNSRSSTSIGLDWGARVTSIGLEFCVPALLGNLADRRLNSGPWLTVIGALLGMAIGMLHVLRLPGELARAAERSKPKTKPGLRSEAERPASGDAPDEIEAEENR